ncbi:Nucleotide-binding universal stress protein, UspA family [Tistlia consotensis]|uniref:Nucleotide-binding universal stress protein, UspA family n=1 Tax=Tistlia consotensis USBA 355 TaxID=560819 RepID=A0A1Y6BTM2_9PROT|nr:universal stress protein [Tistlia consotensis]SMF27704.1 Nucleotide-binding universal stress protein, UspA family [Tistlia consotensis USBA 355]SNR65757.1 Nucleotide-binding universal stress protein, UspA family [Tistlia consotensis]
MLVLPYAGNFTEIGRRVMVAWNGSRESARAVHDALPFLIGAEKVVLYGIDRPGAPHSSATGIYAHLSRHGVAVSTEGTVVQAETEAVGASLSTVGDFGFSGHGEVRHVPAQAISEADALLAALSDHVIDLLVMGAYGHSRLREIVLGGVTHELLRQMTAPVLMSH